MAPRTDLRSMGRRVLALVPALVLLAGSARAGEAVKDDIRKAVREELGQLLRDDVIQKLEGRLEALVDARIKAAAEASRKEVEDLRTAVKDRDAKVAALEKQVGELQTRFKELGEIQAHLEDRDARIADLRKKLEAATEATGAAEKARAAQMEALQNELKRSNEKVAQLEADLKDRDGKVSALGQTLQEQAAAAAQARQAAEELQAGLNQRDARIQEVEKQLADLARLEKELEKREAQIAQLEQKVAEKVRPEVIKKLEPKVIKKLEPKVVIKEAPAESRPALEERPFIGILHDRPPSAVAKELGLGAGEGVLVVEVVPRSPAAKVGLRPGDVITHIGGEPASVENLRGMLSKRRPGDAVEIVALRGPEKLEKKLVLSDMKEFQAWIAARAKRPMPVVKPRPEPVERPAEDVREKVYLGIEVEQETEKDLKIIDLEAGYTADAAGLRTGDVIRKVNGVEVSDLEALVKIVESLKVGDEVAFTFERDGKLQDATVVAARLKGAATRTEVKIPPEEGPATPANAFLGVGVEAAEGGLRVLYTEKDSPADREGIRPGTTITSADGKPVKSEGDLLAILKKRKPGDEIRMEVRDREGTERVVGVKLGARQGERTVVVPPAPEPEPAKEPEPSKPGPPGWLGIRGVNGRGGVEVVTVLPDGPSSGVLQPGDVITDFGDARVNTVAELKKAIEAHRASDVVVVKIRRAGQESYVTVKLGRAEPSGASMPPVRPRAVAVGPLGERIAGAIGLFGERILAPDLVRLYPGGAAVRAGLRLGDFVLSINGQPVRSLGDLGAALRARRPGEPLRLSIRRRPEETGRGE